MLFRIAFICLLGFYCSSCSRFCGSTSAGPDGIRWVYSPLDPGISAAIADDSKLPDSFGEPPKQHQLKSAPRIKDGRIYFRDGKRRLHVLDQATGEPLWCGPDNVCSYLIEGNTVYTGSVGKAQNLTREEVESGGPPLISFSNDRFAAKRHLHRCSLRALELKTGAERWHADAWCRNGHIELFLHEKALIVLSGDSNYFFALDKATGKQLWHHDDPYPFPGASSHRNVYAVTGESIFFCSGSSKSGSRIAVLDADTGNATNSLELPEEREIDYVRCLFSVPEGAALITGTEVDSKTKELDMNFYELNRSAREPVYGLRLGRLYRPGEFHVRGAIDTIYVWTVARQPKGMRGLLYSIDRREGKTNWVLSFDRPIRDLVPGERGVVLGSVDNGLFCIADGKKVWERIFPAPYEIIPAGSDVFACCDFVVLSVDPKTGEITGREGFNSVPKGGCYSNGELFVATSDHKIHALKTPLKKPEAMQVQGGSAP